MKPLSAVDLFCGAGGLSTGLLNSGMDVNAAFDNSEIALQIYRKNIATHAT